MLRFGFLLWILAITACSNEKKNTTVEDEESTAFNFDNFSQRFKETSLPYQLSDTSLLDNKDTAAIRSQEFAALITDSVKTKLLGKATKIKYVPIVRFKQGNKAQYFLVKAESGSKKAALLTVFNNEGQFVNAFPFLVPDTDSKTHQASTVDKYYSITRAISRRMPDDVVVDGKDVYAYDDKTQSFALVMTDVLEDGTQELINPIDTLSRKNQYAGDYVKDKRNLVSIRDGRNENEISFFIHFERMNGECNGELKGTALMTSSKTAVYNTGGDPCVLEFHFSAKSVRLKEVEGCGQYRGVKCVIEGSFPKKRETKADSTKNRKS